MIKRLFAWFMMAAVLALLPGYAGAQEAVTRLRWNADGGFRLLPAYDSGNRQDECFIAAPWNSGSWGVEASTFTNSLDHTLDWSRFAILPNRRGQLYLYGKDQSGQFGSVRALQGDAWGGSHCGAIPWRKPAPLAVNGRSLVLKIDLYRNSPRLLTADNSWIMYAANLWFTSPAFPAGGDIIGRKPLVFDFALFQRCNIAGGCGLRIFEDADAFHYQFRLTSRYADTARCANRPGWRCYTIPLNSFIRAALNHPWETSGSQAIAASTLELRQMDFVVELKNAEGAGSIDNFWLEYR